MSKIKQPPSFFRHLANVMFVPAFVVLDALWGHPSVMFMLAAIYVIIILALFVLIAAIIFADAPAPINQYEPYQKAMMYISLFGTFVYLMYTQSFVVGSLLIIAFVLATILKFVAALSNES